MSKEMVYQGKTYVAVTKKGCDRMRILSGPGVLARVY